MIRYLFDTNVVSDSRRPERTNASFQQFLAAVKPEWFCVSVLTILEIETGITRQEGRDAAFARLLANWFEQLVLPVLEDRIVPVDLKIVRRAGRLKSPNGRPTNDTLIAATALDLGLPVVTRNVADFAALGVDVIDPWNYTAPASS
ncbi:type II toxin-antitoxin system VapC family toxin [Mangrovibrevibacter kandeliae]|uniref:type II toxin-antitoxin system VapC family toxin n=1 Tax=Mangrovibrevibacter kandeliae TaxID=2968473 RepID=UPI0021178BE6|nr:type II toxin-antitoxin system VapC family toxin [Aurantimonas sp. CSK15Z-1]